MNRAVETTLPTRCPVFGDIAPVRHDDTIISLDPEPHMLWICPNCNEVHRWTLDVTRFDFLTLVGYDILAALNGEPVPVTVTR